MVSGDVTVRRAEVDLQLDGIAGGERDHGLQTYRGGLRDMRAADLAARSVDLGRGVQHQPPAHECRGPGSLTRPGLLSQDPPCQ